MAERDGALAGVGVEGHGLAIDHRAGLVGGLARAGEAALDEFDLQAALVDALGLDAGLDLERVAAENGLGGPDVGHAEVLRVARVADADGQDGHLLALGIVAGGGGVHAARVLAVGDDHEAGHRVAGDGPEGVADGPAQVRAGAGGHQRRHGRPLRDGHDVLGRRLALGRQGLGLQTQRVAGLQMVRERHDPHPAARLKAPQEPAVVLLQERVDDLGPAGRVGLEGVGLGPRDGGHAGRPRVVVVVADGHRERVVQQQHHVRLDGPPERDAQGRTHQDDDQEDDDGDADGRQQHPHAPRALARLALVQVPHHVQQAQDGHRRGDGQPRRRRVRPDELRLRVRGEAALVEAEQRQVEVVHACGPMVSPSPLPLSHQGRGDSPSPHPAGMAGGGNLTGACRTTTPASARRKEPPAGR